MSKIKGQNLRLFVGDSSSQKCIATAVSCQFHVAGSVEESSTKDSTGDWAENEITGLSWDASCDALVLLDTDSGAKNTVDLLGLMVNKTLVTLKFEQASGSNNRTAGTAVKSGTAYITDFSVNSANRQNATYTVQFTGTGALS